MCFSAPVSFVAGAALSAAGVATIRMTSRKAEIALAMIPLLFGVQQLTEGMIWLSFRNDSQLPNATLTFVYSLFSHVLWPIYIVQFPVTARVLEKHIAYESPHFYIVAVMLLYLTATCASSLFSSNRVMQVFGALSLATFMAAYAIHVATFFSVWCFFAAILSFIIYYYFRQARTGAHA